MNPPSLTVRRMRIMLALSVLAVSGCASRVPTTAKYSFWLERFSSIALDTTTGKAAIKVKTSTKQENSERIIFESPLAPASTPPGAIAAFATPAGTLLTLTQLPKPIVNDPNRGINSGDWKLTITGKGPELVRLKADIQRVAFGEKKPFVYLGKKDP